MREDWSFILDRTQRQARAAPERPALVDRHRVVTFGQLHEETVSWSSLLAAHGIREGQAVGLLMVNCANAVTALLGAAGAGGTTILLPPTLAAEEVRRYCQAAGAHIVLTTPAHREAVVAAGGQALRCGQRDLEVFRLDVPSKEGLQPGDFIGQLTSGVDDPPKIAIRTHAAVWSEIEDFAGEIDLTAQDTVLVLPPISHSYGLIGGTLAPLCRGGRVILQERFVPEEALTLIRRERPTILYAVPVMYQALTAPTLNASEDATFLRLCFSAGAFLPRETEEELARRFGWRICQNYGTTEAGVICLRLERAADLQASVGRPIRSRTVTIADDRLRPLGTGSVGRVIVQSPALARGYLDGSPSTWATLEGDRFVTGDLGWMNRDGYLFLTGRMSQLIRIAGATIDAAEVERVIAALPGVREVAVVGVPHLGESARLKAVVVAEGLVTGDVLRHCRRHLKGLQVPKTVEFRASLPRTPAGKVLRRTLRAS